jgi:hypothetical protein
MDRWMIHTIVGWYIQSLDDTYNRWMTHTIVGWHIQSLDDTYNRWMIHTIVGWYIQSLDDTYNRWIVHTIVGWYIQSLDDTYMQTFLISQSFKYICTLMCIMFSITETQLWVRMLDCFDSTAISRNVSRDGYFSIGLKYRSRWKALT